MLLRTTGSADAGVGVELVVGGAINNALITFNNHGTLVNWKNAAYRLVEQASMSVSS